MVQTTVVESVSATDDKIVVEDVDPFLERMDLFL